MKAILQTKTIFKIHILCLCTGLLTSLSSVAQGKAVDLSFVERYEIPGVSIRAIELVSDSELHFAGTKGRVGRVLNGALQVDSISFHDRYPEFRSIAHNGQHTFVLSIENPALLYRLQMRDSAIQTSLVYKEEHQKVFYDAMVFTDSLRGVAMGDPTEDCLSVILTNDGGNNWQKLSCNNLPQVEKGEAAFAASNTNLATLGNKVWMVSGGKKARVWMSSDYGQNWKAVPTPVQQGQNMTGIFSTAFYDQQQGVIMGGNWEEKENGHQSKARTTDGGESWNLIADGKAPGYISCVQYLPGSKGKELIAVSTEGIYYSGNSGDQWEQIAAEGFYSVRFADADTAWLSGNEKIVKVKLDRQ